MPHFSGGSARLEQTFRRGGPAVELFVEVFPLPSRAGAELISYGNSIHAEANERLFPNRVVRPRSGALGAEFRVRETMVQGSRDRLVWYWYDVGGRLATSGVRAKLLEARTLVTEGRSAQRVVVVSTLVTSSREEAAERLQDFLVTHAPALGLGTVPGG
jgi:EpsI family protein